MLANGATTAQGGDASEALPELVELGVLWSLGKAGVWWQVTKADLSSVSVSSRTDAVVIFSVWPDTAGSKVLPVLLTAQCEAWRGQPPCFLSLRLGAQERGQHAWLQKWVPGVVPGSPSHTLFKELKLRY